MDKLKLWCVRRWLHLLPLKELKNYIQTEGIRRALDESMEALYKGMVDNMMQYYTDEVTELPTPEHKVKGGDNE